MRKRPFQRGLHLFRIIDVNAKNPCSFGDLCKIGIDQVRGVAQETCRFHLQFYKAQRPIVEHDHFHGKIQLPER